MLNRQRLKTIVEDRSSRAGRRFEITIQLLILFSIVTFSIETLPDLSESTRKLLGATELIIVSLFTAEYLARIWVADKPSAYIFSFYGVIDLLAILPFYLALGMDLRALRIFRLMRLLRIFKMFRYSKAVQRLTRALVIAREELVLFSIVTVMLLYLSAVGIYYFENEAQPEIFASVFHSLWWAVATLTTVGYGDVYPITVGGRIFTFLVLMLGLGVVAVPAGLMASALSQASQESAEAEAREREQDKAP